jgi:predicted MPP superfamily phosphohydrolase
MMPERRISRRRFLRRAVSGGATLTLTGAGRYAYARQIEAWWFEVVRHDLELPGLPDAFAGVTVAQISDLHLGAFARAEDHEAAVRAVQALRPEVIVITGDLVSRLDRGEPEMLVQLLSGLSAPEGVYAVLGNHDFWENAQLVTASLRRAGVGVLRNRHVTLHRGGQTLYLTGVDDVLVRRQDLSAALDGVPASGKAILLAHEPDFADEAARDRRIMLQLSGHSHGDQVCVPGYGGLHFPPWGRKYPSGLYRIGELTLCTNRGLGMVMMPLRFCCRPEITLFTLRPASS